jgi:hypothetical protein
VYLLNAECWLFLNISFPIGNKFVLDVALPPCIPYFGLFQLLRSADVLFFYQIVTFLLLHQFSAASPSLSFHFTLILSTGVSASLFSIGLRFFRPWRQTAKHGPHSSFTSPYPEPPSLEFGHCILVYRSHPPLISTLSVFPLF